MAVHERLHVGEFTVKGVVNRIRGHDCRKRERAGCDGFGHGDEIGHDFGFVHGEHGAETAESHGDFVKGEVNVEFASQLAEFLEVQRRVEPPARSPLSEWFDEHCGDFMGAFVERLFHVFEAVGLTRLAGLAVGATVAVRSLHADVFRHDRTVQVGKEVVTAHRERAQRVAVVSVGQADEFRFLGLAVVLAVAVTHLHGDFHGAGPVARKEHAGHFVRSERDKAVSQFFGGTVRDACEQDMLKCARLFGQRFGDARVGVAENIGPPRADSVYVGFAFVVVYVYPFSGCDFEKRMLLNVFHLGHRMPESLFFIESTMSEKLYEFISKELEEFRERSLFRQIPPVDSGADKFLVFEGRRLLNLASNNYLGIADHPDLKAAAAQAVEQYGTSSGASRLISGNFSLFDRLEAEISDFKGLDDALVVGSGFTANLMILSTLADRHTVVFSDRLNHASIVDGIRLSGAQHVRYRHNDMAHLASLMEKHAYASRKILVTDTVFSMDGDCAELASIVDLCENMMSCPWWTRPTLPESWVAAGGLPPNSVWRAG